MSGMNQLVSTASTSSICVQATASEICEIMLKADIDFKERAFAPFWDDICNAATELGCLEADMKSIAKSYRNYKKLYWEYLKIYRDGDPLPNPFPEHILSPLTPDIMRGIMDHFHFLVRGGQRDFQFAVIYEHYRTREVLAEGFRNLSDAIHYLSREVGEGFGELRTCLEDMQTCFVEEYKSTRQAIVTTIEKNEILAQEHQREFLESYMQELEAHREALTVGFEQSEAGQKDRHDEVIVEGKRDRELIKDIDRRLGGKEWWRH